MTIMNFPKSVLDIFCAVRAAGGHSYVVGGSVRDFLMGHEPKDWDIEVYGLPASDVEDILSAFGKVDAVGKSFGVLKVRTHEGLDLDVSLPRRESKSGQGHKGFSVEADHTMTPREAASRRDFTVNSMMVDEAGNLHDYFGGAKDIKDGVLHPTSEAFEDDPLRVMRAFQFCARFDMHPSVDLMWRAEAMLPSAKTLPVERFWMEWEKWALKSKTPSRGLEFLVMSDWIDLYPAIGAMLNVPQDPIWHPEGSVWVHTCCVVNAAAKIAVRENLNDEDRLTLMFAALCHDFGKPSTTFTREDGRIVSPGHGPAGVPLTKEFLASIGAPHALVTKVAALVLHHLDHVDFCGSERQVRRLALALSEAGTTIRMQSFVADADNSGRPPIEGGMGPKMKAMVELAEKLACRVEPPRPILLGRHLISEFGLQPSKDFGRILDAVFQLQLDGEITTLDEAISIARNLI